MDVAFLVLKLENVFYLKNELMKWADFLHVDTNLEKIIVTLIIIWWALVKNGWDLIDHRTLKLGLFHKWCDELSRLIERFVHVDSDGIIFGLMTNLFCIFDI